MDLVCYWFDKALREVLDLKARRVGLVATNSIRGGVNRQVLEAIAEKCGITEAWSDEPWINEGAAVRVSLVCFGSDAESVKLDGHLVQKINPDLTASEFDLTLARPLRENRAIAFNGIQKTGPFEVPGTLARTWITNSGNPNGRSSREVLRPYWNGIDVTR